MSDQNFDASLGTAIRRLREQRGMTMAECAASLSSPVSYQSWQKWEMGRGLNHARLRQIATLFGLSVTELHAMRDEISVGKVIELPSIGRRSAPSPDLIPLFGVVAAAGERIAFNQDQAIRYVARHPGQSGFRDVGAAEVIGESMFPRYRPQEIVYFVRGRHPTRTGDVVVELSNGTAIIKEYEGRRDGKVWLREYWPEERIFGLPADEVVGMHAVVGRG